MDWGFPYPEVGTLQIKQGQTGSFSESAPEWIAQSTRSPTSLPLSRMASPAAPPQLSALDAIFQGLRNKSHEVRLRAAEDLKQYVNPSSLSRFSRSAAQEVPGHKRGGRDVL